MTGRCHVASNGLALCALRAGCACLAFRVLDVWTPHASPGRSAVLGVENAFGGVPEWLRRWITSRSIASGPPLRNRHRHIPSFIMGV